MSFSELMSHPLAYAFVVFDVFLLGIILILYKKMRKAQTTYHRPVIKLESHTIVPTQEFNAYEQSELIHKTFEKFVPRQFAEHFARHGEKGLENLQLGRADEDDVAILFCDIRGFTGLCERMSPQELMNFLNSYFMRMNEPVHNNAGFIDKFIGDAIMALFDNPEGTNKDKAADAIRAAIDMRKALKTYNLHRRNSGYPPVDTGIGVHFGPVILGTVGSEERMDTTVIGDSVNIAQRLEGLAPYYQVDIIASRQLLDEADAINHFAYRLLDWVRVKGKQHPVEIYEIIQHQDPMTIEAKREIDPLIIQALAHRKQQEWQKAKEVLIKASTIAPHDPIIGIHLQQLEKLQYVQQPPDWDGAVEVY